MAPSNAMAASSHLRAWDKTPPSLHGGDEAEVLEHMLLAEEARGHLSAVRLPDDDLAEDLLPEEDPERRVQHRAVADIAYECGFSDHSAFTRAFRAATGVTPTEFRETHGWLRAGAKPAADRPPTGQSGARAVRGRVQ